MYIFVYKAST